MSDTPNNPTFSSQQVACLHGIFFLSGAAGLIFEVLWFRLTALSIGSTIWAATAVLAAFMAGLAAGNGIAAFLSERVRQPLRLYARLEVVVAASGLLLIFILPNFGAWLAPMSIDLLDAGSNWQLQVLRLLFAFMLMLIPTTAMGLTLPLLVRTLQTQSQSGRVIGQLYSWNTLGAVSGLLISEWLLIEMLGIQGSAVLAASACLVAAITAAKLNRPIASFPTDRIPLKLRFALVAALTGAVLLGLEVIWFRLLLLHLRGTDSSFAYMLAMVLGGIASGSILASLWLRSHKPGISTIHLIALLSALSVLLGYLTLNLPLNIWIRAGLLTMPTSLLSGAILPMLAANLAEQNQRPGASTGWVWLANTIGGAVGAALAGLYLLPAWGMENSLLILGLGYVAVMLCMMPRQAFGKAVFSSLLAAGCYLLFPKGWIDSHLDSASAVYRHLDGARVVQVREGLNETVQLLERRKHGQPYSYRLVTDGYSMSGTERDSLRYMKLFAWLPQSLHPRPETALLISYGVGTTASALLADGRLQKLNVIDLSPDVLAMSPLIHGEHRDPLIDPRARVIVEDGRQFLLLTEQSFDLITAEPPPPRMKGVVNLYTQEYFQLIYERLNPGGYTSYWLPVDQMTMQSSHAIIAAFCNVFNDCSLWSGSNYNWILLGSKSASPVSTDVISQLWRPPQWNELAALGLEKPGMLGSSFLADATQLRSWLTASQPLTDHWPKRLDERPARPEDIEAYARWADNLQSQKRFASSQWIQENFPAEWRADALGYFDLQPILNNEIPADPKKNLPIVHRILTSTNLVTPVYWLLGSDLEEQQIIDSLLEGGYQVTFAYPLGIRALTERNYPAAASLFTEALQAGDTRAHGPTIYSLCRSGEIQQARSLAASLPDALAFRCWSDNQGVKPH